MKHHSSAFREGSGIVLLATTIATIAVMWQTAFWATAIAEVMAFVLASLWLIAGLRGWERLHFKPVLLILIGTALWPAVQLFAGTTIYRWTTATSILYWATAGAIVFVGIQIFDDEEIKIWYLRGLLIFGFMLGIISPLQRFTADHRIFWMFDSKYAVGAMGPFVYANQYAAFVELILPIALAWLFSEGSRWRSFYGLAAAVLYASTLASGSRTGFILATIEIVAIPLLCVRRGRVSPRQSALVSSIFLCVLIVLGLAMGPEKLLAKLEQTDPYQGRREMLASSLRMIPDRPMMGVGMGNWAVAYPAYATFDDGFYANQAHNDWVQWAVEGGIPFVLLMVAAALAIFPQAIRSGWGTGVAVVFVQCFVDYPIQRMGVAIVFFSLVGTIAASVPTSAAWKCPQITH